MESRPSDQKHLTPQTNDNAGEKRSITQNSLSSGELEKKETEQNVNSITVSRPKSIFSINQHLDSLNTIEEPVHLPTEPFDLNKVLEIWLEFAQWAAQNKNSIHAEQINAWKPVRIEGNQIIVQTPSFAVESLIKENLESFIVNFRKKLNNFAVEFSFERIETQTNEDTDRSISENVKNLKMLMDQYPIVKDLVRELDLHPSEL